MKTLYQIYLYTVSLLALIALVISGAFLLDLGLKAFIFTKADRYQNPPVYPMGAIEAVPSKTVSGTALLYPDVKCGDKDTKCLEQQRQIIDRLKQQQEEYQKWQDEQNMFWNASRQSQAANALAFFLISLPIYIFHWRLVLKHRKEEKRA